MMRSRTRVSTAIIVLIAALHVVLSWNWRIGDPENGPWQTVIGSDGEGFHAYLTGLFIQHDLAKAPAPDHVFTPAGDGRVIKYFCGTALLQAPFFLVAHSAASAGLADPDGRSFPYQLAVVIGSLCFLVFGLFCLRSLLLTLGIGDPATAITIGAVGFGTGALYHSVMIPSMSHVAAFAAIAWTFERAAHAWRSPPGSGLWQVALGLGLVALIRPTDLLITLALPVVILNDPHVLKEWIIRQGLRKWSMAAITFLLVILIQPLLWYLQCGEAFIRPYSEEGFLWDRPMIWSSLFGARKGLFFYWPLLLLCAPGLVLVCKRNSLSGMTWLVGMLAFVYVTGCWWTWYYGFSYGLRPYTDVLPVMAIPIAVFIDAAWSSRGRALLLLAVPLALLQCFQAWQYHVGIIHPTNMDLEKYKRIFLRTDGAYRALFEDGNMRPPYSANGMRTLVDLAYDPAAPLPPWSGGYSWRGPNGELYSRLDGAHSFGPAIVIPANELPADRQFFIRTSVRVQALTEGGSLTAQWVCSLEGPDGHRVYMTFPLNNTKRIGDTSWQHWQEAILLPRALPGEELRIYVWQPGPQPLLIDKLEVKILVQN